MGIPRVWLTEYEWPKGQFFDKGNDEFTRLTFVIRLPFERAFVIPYRYCKCEDCDIQRETDIGYRLIKSDIEDDESFVDYLIKVHHYSKNRLPLNKYFRWSAVELHRYFNYGIVPVE